MQSSRHVGLNGLPAQQHSTSRGNNKAEQWCQLNYLKRRTVRVGPTRGHSPPPPLPHAPVTRGRMRAQYLLPHGPLPRGC